MPDLADVKIAVLKCAFGIRSLEDRELYEHLERFWADAFKAGCEETGAAMLAELRKRGILAAK